MAAPEVPDWTRPTQLFAKDPSGDLVPVVVDANGQLYIVIQGALESITADVNVTQEEKDREIQGADGATLRTVAVDASGQIIMVPRGQSGNYMLVDASGYLTAILKGLDGATLRSVEVDSGGRIINVIRDPTSDNYVAVDSSGYLTNVIKGLDGATLRTVAVDASGNIVAVMKGEYSGALKTVATDASGRIVMIPTDPTDVWGNAISMGNAELAARLGVVQRHDNRGSTAFIDNFENGLCHFIKGYSGSGYDHVLTTAESKFGGYALKLVGGSTSEYYAHATWWIGYSYTTKVGFEVGFRIGDDVDYILLELALYDGSKQHYGQVRYDYSGQKWEYLDSAAAWQDLLTSYVLTATAYGFYSVKLVIDFVNNLYTRFLSVDDEVNMSAYAIREAASGSAPHIQVRVRVYSDAGKNGWIYVDPIVITTNEPA